MTDLTPTDAARLAAIRQMLDYHSNVALLDTDRFLLSIYDAAQAELARLRAPTGGTWKCKANPTAIEPQDCGWPTCGCDPYADKVIAAIEESGCEIVRAPTGDAVEVATAIVDADDWERFSETEPYDWEKLIGKIAAAITAAEARVRQAEREALRNQLGYRLNAHLCEMREGYDDSIVGFNHAWNVIDSVFDNPTPEESERQAGVRDGIEMASVVCEELLAAIIEDQGDREYRGRLRKAMAAARRIRSLQKGTQ